MVLVSYRNSHAKVLNNGFVQVDPPCAQTGVKSDLCTFKCKFVVIFKTYFVWFLIDMSTDVNVQLTPKRMVND